MGQKALVAWAKRGETAPLEHWLEGLLDAEGVPDHLEVGEWPALVQALDAARRVRREEWSERLDAGIEGLVRALLRFARAGGAMVFSPVGAPAIDGLPDALRRWTRRLSDPGLAKVVDWWYPQRADGRPAPHTAPPLPAWSSQAHPLAMLRASWSAQGDFLAIDHRQRGPMSLIELTGLGCTWLGPSWTAELGPESFSRARPRPTLWVSNSTTDLFEWTSRAGAVRLTRTALLLRGRHLALLADQVDGRGESYGWTIAVPESLAASPLSGGSGWLVGSRRGSPKAQLIPIGLPQRSADSDHGTFALEGGQLRLSRRSQARRSWLPLLASWDPARNRRAVRWKRLTVAENSKICSPDTAFAARISWGRHPGETLLIYRSLARPALRSVLGHQTRARFLVALFGADGDVVPIVKVD
jgi:hypothetical protein